MDLLAKKHVVKVEIPKIFRVRRTKFK